jgi:hypothetical protein
MAPVSSYTLISPTPLFNYGVLVILVICIGILVIVIALMALGLGQQAVGWVINQWQHLGLRQHSPL